MVTVKKKKLKSTAKLEEKRISLDVFLERYTSILYAARDFLVQVVTSAEKSGEDPWVTTPQVVNHLVEHKPAAYIKSFGTDHPKELKYWRLLQILRNANYLGAYGPLGIRVAHGKGMTLERIKTRKAKLRVVK